MKTKFTILVLLFFGWSTLSSYADEPVPTENVCAGSTITYRLAETNSGSTYTWGIGTAPGSTAGTINSGAGTSAVEITWSATTGSEILWVYETNAAGCVGETSRIEIIRQSSPTAEFAKAALCYGESLEVVLTGTGPWSVDYTLDGGDVSVSGITASPFVLNDVAGSYALVRVADKSCANETPNGITTALIAEPLKALVILHE